MISATASPTFIALVPSVWGCSPPAVRPLRSRTPCAVRVGPAPTGGNGRALFPPLDAGDNRGIDPGNQIGWQRSGLGGGDAFRQFLAVLHAQHQRVDVERQRIAVGDHRRIGAKLGAEAAEAGGACVVADFGMVVRQRAVDRRGQRAGLHRADAHDADAVGARRRHHRARLRRPVEELQPAGRVQQVGDALHGGRGRALVQQP